MAESVRGYLIERLNQVMKNDDREQVALVLETEEGPIGCIFPFPIAEEVGKAIMAALPAPHRTPVEIETDLPSGADTVVQEVHVSAEPGYDPDEPLFPMEFHTPAGDLTLRLRLPAAKQFARDLAKMIEAFERGAKH